MNDFSSFLDLEINEITPVTSKVSLIKSGEKFYVLKELTKHERKIYYFLKTKKIDVLNFFKEFSVDNKIYHLYPYLEDVNSDKKVYSLFEALKELKDKTKINYDPSKLDEFRLKKLIIIMNDKFKSLELKFREEELREVKDDNSWIILSNYHIILKSKDMIYKLLSKVKREIEMVKDLEYSLLHSYPTLEHFKSNKLLSFPYSKYGYYVNDLYKAYVSIEHFDIDLKSLMDKYLNDKFSKTYFKLMVLYTYVLSFDSIDFHSLNGVNKYLCSTKKIAKFMTIFKEY